MSFLQILRRYCVSAASLALHFVHGGIVVAGLLVVVYLAFGVNQYGLKGPWLTGMVRSDNAPEFVAWVGDDNLGVESTVRGGESLSPQMKRVVDYLSRRYKVSSLGVEPLVASAEDVGKRIGLDPLLLVAIMAVESSFNPIAESPMGAQGLMQVIPRFHQEKIVDQGSDASLLNPQTNIVVGARVLKEYLVRTGSMQNALQVYNGATNDAVGSMYANKVLAEKQRLEAAAKRRPVPPVQARTRTAAPAVVRSPAQVGPIALAPRLPTLLQETREAATVAEASVAASVHD
ncbi:MAG: transglycosylase SLT domain-containing protein [Sterolibacteriaceae bacterium]|nr:transglycosylase SLT domain-containing protein [Sterolibacteriaceae bacterium]